MSDLKRRWAGCSVSAEDRVIVIASISCFFACLSQGCGISIVASSVSEMAQIAGVEVTEFGTVFFAGGIGFLVGCLCCSSLLDAGVVDGVPKHYLCCVAATLAGLATVLLMHTSSFHMMALYVLVQVFGFGGVHLFSTLAIQEMWGQRVQPWLQMKATCGGVGGIVGPVMVAHWGYRRACLGGALLCLTPLLVIALLLAWQMWQVQGRVSQVPLESQVCAPTSEAQGLRQGLGLGLEQGLGLGVLSSIDENGYDTTPPTLTSIPTTAAVASTPTPTPTPASTPTPSALEFLYGGARAAYVATEILQIERGMRRAVRHRSATLPYSGAGTSSSTASCPAPNSLALFPSLFRAEGRAASFRSGSDLCTLEQQQLQQQQSGNQTQRDFPFKLRMPQQAEEGEEGEMGGAGMTGETGTLSSPRPILHLSPCPSSRPSPRLKPRGGPQSNSPHKDGDVEDNRGRRFSVDDYLPADGEYGEYEDTDREYGGGCRGSVDASGGLCVEVDVEDGDGNGDGDGDGDGDLFSDESTPLTKAFGVAGRRRMSFGSMGEGQEQTQMQTQRSGRSRTLSFATPEIVASLGLLQDSGIVLVPFAFRGILVVFLLFYVGLFHSYIDWVGSFALMTGVVSDRELAAALTSDYYFWMTLGCCVSIPATLLFSNTALARAQLAITALGALLLCTGGGFLRLKVATALISYGESCLLALSLGLAMDYGFTMDTKATITLMISATAGESVFPLLMAQLIRTFGAAGFPPFIAGLVGVMVLSYLALHWQYRHLLCATTFRR